MRDITPTKSFLTLIMTIQPSDDSKTAKSLKKTPEKTDADAKLL